MPMIIGEMKRYLRDNNAIHVSRSVRDLAYRAMGAKEQLVRSLHREPTPEEITAALNAEGISCTSVAVEGAMEAIMAPVSLFDPLSGGDGEEDLCVLDRLPDRSGGEDAWVENLALRESIARLSPREKNILAMRFDKGKTQMEIAEEIGISQAQVSRLEKGALNRIKQNMQ